MLKSVRTEVLNFLLSDNEALDGNKVVIEFIGFISDETKVVVVETSDQIKEIYLGLNKEKNIQQIDPSKN